MLRGAYAGTAGVLGGNSLPVIGVQSETTAYLSRFTTQPSATYKAALNELIYKAKKAGAWSVWQDLYLFVADTQADALRNLVSAARDATIGGALTFTANRGFSGTFNGTNKVSMPFSTTSVTAASGTAFAGSLIGGTTGAVIGTAATNVASVTISATNIAECGGAISGKTISGALGSVFTVIGCDGANGYAADGVVNTGGGSGVEASPVTTANTARLNRICALGVAPTITATQLTAFLSALNQFMSDVGANP